MRIRKKPLICIESKVGNKGPVFIARIATKIVDDTRD